MLFSNVKKAQKLNLQALLRMRLRFYVRIKKMLSLITSTKIRHDKISNLPIFSLWIFFWILQSLALLK